MCRVLGYLGGPVSLEGILYETDSALVRQSYSPRMMDAFLNLAGFGMAARLSGAAAIEDPVLPDSYERMRWFPLPGEAQRELLSHAETLERP